MDAVAGSVAHGLEAALNVRFLGARQPADGHVRPSVENEQTNKQTKKKRENEENDDNNDKNVRGGGGGEEKKKRKITSRLGGR